MTFNDLQIITPIKETLNFIGYKKPTPIQQDSIPILLNKEDLLASAQTGTGKTAAFAIPILQHLYNEKMLKQSKGIKALILTPTRELAIQVEKDFRVYSKKLNLKSTTVYGGVPQKKQVLNIKKGVDILIATPGRLIDLMNQRIIKLDFVSYLVLDEADLMLDMGFINDVLKIVRKTSVNRQTMLFSATMPKEIEALAKEILKTPKRIQITPVAKTVDLIKQNLYFVKKDNKTKLLLKLINIDPNKSWLIFTRTKHSASRLVEVLKDFQIKADSIHGNKSQSHRERALNGFKNGKTNVLVATDIASRGLDIEKLDYVVNYNLPELAETYIHRIGRTGRAGLTGVAISFCDQGEKKLITKIEKHINMKLNVINNELTEKQNDKSKTKKKNCYKFNKEDKNKKRNKKQKNKQRHSTKSYK